MASVTIQKWTTAGACGGQINHIYRTREHYGNQDIDRALADRNEMAGTAEEARARIRETIAQVDAAVPPQRVRTDRKTIAELCIPAPRAGMNDEDARRFLTAACIELVHEPGMHVVGIGLHGDEVHEYINPDSKTRVQSRLHVHVLVVPDVPGRGCNMKSWLTKSRYREINQLLDRVCERVKLASQRAEAAELTAKIDTLRQEKAAAIAQIDMLRQKQTGLTAQIDTQEAQIRALTARNDKLQQETAKARRMAQDALQEYQTAAGRTQVEQQRADELREEINRLDVVRELSTVPENRTLNEAKSTARKAFVGDNVVLPRREFESICSLAETCWTNHKAVLQMQREKDEAERNARFAEQAAEQRARQITLEQAREQASRDRKLGRYERMEREFPQVFREMDERMHIRTIDHDRGRSR